MGWWHIYLRLPPNPPFISFSILHRDEGVSAGCRCPLAHAPLTYVTQVPNLPIKQIEER